MTPERWQQIEDILDEVMPLAAEERAVRIGRLCHGDTALRSQVEEMMGFCELVQAESFLETPPHLAAQDLLMESILAEPPDEDLRAGTVVGPYTIIERVGRGGMGEVYLAERADPRMRVALKVVKRGMDTREILQRFRYEREILARLNHAHIAQLYGGGVTEDGRPYFAMEYVEGKTLEAYCDDLHLSVPARLALFKTVCEAVRYAHRNLVVHRDLKPGNILVSEGEAGKPVVKLLDFGIAKLLEEDASLHTMPLTQAGALRMTPGYAAPEQVRGQHTTPATDVYALGVILYGLLTGRRPYYFEDRSVTGIESVICLRMPERPSTVVGRPLRSSGDGAAETTPDAVSQQRDASPTMLRRQLAGDLDAITMMALRKEPERRYASAAEFFDDIERYLDKRPVMAQHDTVAYRTAKFVQRHKVGVFLTAAMVLLIATLVTFFTVQLAIERNFARQERDRALATRDLMVKMIEMRDPDGSVATAVVLDTVFTRALIRAGLSNMDDLVDQRDQAYMLDVMGQVSLSYNLFGQADSLYRRALQIKQKELGAEHPDLAESVFGLGQVAHNQERNEHADSLYRWALRLLEEAAPEKQRRIPEIQNNLAFVVGRLAMRQSDDDERQARLEEAKTWYQKALTAEDERLQTNPEDKEVRLLKAGSLRGLATILRWQGRVEDAEARYHETLTLIQEGFGASHPEVANVKFSLAILLNYDKEDYEGAERYYHEALAIYRQAYGQQHIAVGNSLYDLAVFYHQRVPDPKLDKADSLYRQAVAVYQAILPAEDSRTTRPLRGLARLLIERGRPTQAEPFLRQSLAIIASRLPEQASSNARVQYWLGLCLTDQGRYREAEAFLQESYAYFRQSRSAARITAALAALVNLYTVWRKPDRVAAYRAALEAVQTTKPTP